MGIINFNLIAILMLLCISFLKADNKMTDSTYDYLSKEALTLKISDYCENTKAERLLMLNEVFKKVPLKIQAGSSYYIGNAYELNLICLESEKED